MNTVFWIHKKQEIGFNTSLNERLEELEVEYTKQSLNERLEELEVEYTKHEHYLLSKKYFTRNIKYCSKILQKLFLMFFFSLPTLFFPLLFVVFS